MAFKLLSFLTGVAVSAASSELSFIQVCQTLFYVVDSPVLFDSTRRIVKH